MTKTEYDLRYFTKFPEKRAAYLAIKNVKKTKGQHLHHWSYRPEHLKCTIEVDSSQHRKIHKYIIYDQLEMMYRRYDTLELLDTKEKHSNFIEKISMFITKFNCKPL